MAGQAQMTRFCYPDYVAVDEKTMELRGRLAQAIAEVYIERGLTHEDIALELGTTRPDATTLMNVQVARFALDRLIGWANVAGVQVDMRVEAPVEPKASEQPGPFAKRREPDHTPVGAMKRQLFTAYSGVIASHAELSQGELAQQFGVSRASMYGIRIGDGGLFKLDKLVQLAPQFGVTVDITAAPATNLR